MPMYAYRCTKCGSEEEHIQRFSDPPKATCDACGAPLERLLSPTAFHLKGGGWYKDGYASSKPGGGDGGGASSSGGDGGSSSSTSSSSSSSDSASSSKSKAASE